MDVVAFAVIIRLLGVLFATTIGGGALWAIGAIFVASFWAVNDIAPEVNTIIGFGFAGGIGGWFIWRPETHAWRSWLKRLPIALASGLLFAWIGLHNFGGLFIGGARDTNVTATYGLPGISPVSGAWVGGMIGSLIPFGLTAGMRALRGRDT